MSARSAMAFCVGALLAPAIAIAQVCGDSGVKPSTTVRSVVLRSVQMPRFYYRADQFVVFVSVQALLGQIDKDAAQIEKDTDPEADIVRRYRDLGHRIERDSAKPGNKDLFVYVIDDEGDSYAPIEALIIHLIESGNAGVSDIGGIALGSVTVVRDRQPGADITEIFAGKKGENRIFWHVNCVAD